MLLSLFIGFVLCEELPQFRRVSDIEAAGMIRRSSSLANPANARGRKFKWSSLQALTVTFTNCIGFGEGLEGIGGVAYIEESQFVAKSVTATSCQADAGGTFALIKSVASVSISTFSDSRARGAGGAILFTAYVDSDPRKEETDSEGLIHADGSFKFSISPYYLGIMSCTFTGCRSGRSGGAVSASGCPDLFIDSTRCERCATGKNGGAASLFYCQSSIRKCLFLECTCGGRGSLRGIDAMGSSSSVKRNRYGVHMTDYRNSGYKSGGGAIFCSERFRSSSDPTDSPCLITDSCCFIKNQCLLPEKSIYKAAGEGFDVNLNNSYYVSYKDRFWSDETLSVVAQPSGSQITKYGTRFYGNRVKFIESVNNRCKDWKVDDLLLAVPATGFGADTDDYATLNPPQGAITAIAEERSYAMQTVTNWKMKTPRATDKGRTNPATIARMGLTINVPTPIPKPDLPSSSYFTRSSVFTATGGFTGSTSFVASNMFTMSSLLTATGDLTVSNDFSESSIFSETTLFTLSEAFTETQHFTESKHFIQSGVFSFSDSFTPHMTRTPVPAGKSLLETVVPVSTVTVSETISALTVTYIEGRYSIVYGAVAVPSYIIEYSRMEMIVAAKKESVLKVSSTVLIGLVCGAAVLLATIASIINWIVTKAGDFSSSEYSEYSSDMTVSETESDLNYGQTVESLWDNKMHEAVDDDDWAFLS